MNHLVAFTLTISILVPALGAQTPKYVWTPTGSVNNAGGSNNTIPFWGVSATYQQILDAADFTNQITTMKGMAMRVAGARTMTGRSWDLRITLSQTKVNAANASSTFSVNLTGTNTAIVFGTTTSFNKFSWSTATGTGAVNPPAFTIPFSSPYVYIKSLGNLCWEWRQKNASTNTTMFVDATYAPSQLGMVLAKIGKGCTVGSATATATISTTGSVSTGYSFQSVLTNAATNANAFMAVGLTPKTQNLGWCAPVELVPLALLPGKTDASGSWTFQAPLALTAGAPAVNVYLQYVFNDASQAAGLGLSDLAGYLTPNVPGAHVVTRIYKSQFGGTTNGDELATTGAVGKYFGLIIGWLQ